jgi:uncharacterized DUF497 family protein
MEFEWDARKDAANQRKHGVGFREASTVFGDPLATTFPDVDHSLSEQRFLTIGTSVSGRILGVAHIENQETIRIISARTVTPRERRFYEKTIEQRSNGNIRPEYDFASMKGGIQGKYYEQYRKGTNVVLLEPDVAEAFPTEGAVNQALRGILKKTHASRRIGGRPEGALKPTSRVSKRRHRG